MLALRSNPNEVTLKRIIQSDGKSKAYINNQGWTVSGLAAFSDFWLDVTSQHAHQKLMDDASIIWKWSMNLPRLMI
jgi:DNA repair protein RecN (Recombination protein N)